MMELQEKIELTEKNIRQALDDYGKHLYGGNKVLNNVSDEFISILAKRSVEAKMPLREMLRKSPVWDERLDALVINGTRTHDPNYGRIYDLGKMIICPAEENASVGNIELMELSLMYFADPTPLGYKRESYLSALKVLAPDAYKPNKKPSRIFKGLCDALGVTDNTAGSRFQQLFAQFADELNSKKINFKLFVSINPAHFLTMSNPKGDERGATLTSCHSFNSTEYKYNNGCSGYALDDVTMIAFTASDPADPETLNNRKTTRQLYMYMPGNGLLLQSRMYNTSGGTNGAVEESQLYRDLIQREISACEGAPNLWKTSTYVGNSDDLRFPVDDQFGGYRDWEYSEFAAKYSIRNDHANDYDPFMIGRAGLCVVCGCEIREGLFCGRHDYREECYDCNELFDEENLYEVHNRHGDTVMVCEDCRDNNYYECYDCEEYFDGACVTDVNGEWVCDACFDAYYETCDCCNNYYRRSDGYAVVEENGDDSTVCGRCYERYYPYTCDECGNDVRALTAAHKGGKGVDICPNCENNLYSNCKKCGELVYHRELSRDMEWCLDCREVEQEAEAV